MNRVVFIALAALLLVSLASAETFSQMASQCGGRCSNDYDVLQYSLDRLIENAIYSLDLQGRTFNLPRPLRPTTTRDCAQPHLIFNGKLLAHGNGFAKRSATFTCTVTRLSKQMTCSGSGLSSYRYAQVYASYLSAGAYVTKIQSNKVHMSTEALQSGSISVKFYYADPVLDLSSIGKWNMLTMRQVTLDGNNKAAGLRTAYGMRGLIVSQCTFSRIYMAGVMPTGASNGMWIVDSTLTSSEYARAPHQRVSVGIHLGTDSKTAGCVVKHFRHGYVSHGSGVVISDMKFDQSTSASGNQDYTAAVVMGGGGPRLPLFNSEFIDGGLEYSARRFIGYLSFVSVLNCKFVVNRPVSHWRFINLDPADDSNGKTDFLVDGLTIRGTSFESKGAAIEGLIRTKRPARTNTKMRRGTSTLVDENSFRNVRTTCWPCSGSFRGSNSPNWGFTLTGKRLLLGLTPTRLLRVHASGLTINGSPSNARPHATVDGTGKAYFKWPGRATAQISFQWIADV